MRTGFRIVLLIICALLGWRIIAVNIANHYADSIDRGLGQAATQALKWESRHPTALYRAALELIPGDLNEAQKLLTQAYFGDPTNPDPLLVLAGLAQAEGKPEEADELVRRAAMLRPVDANLQSDVARYWLDRRRFDLALKHWSAALNADATPRSQARYSQAIFNSFRAVLMDQEGIEAFKTITASPPSWWIDFFADTAKRSVDTGILERLYRMRRQSASFPLTLAERKIFIERLLKDGRMGEAYLTWINSLTAEQRQHLGPLYNGGFELPITDWGYDWKIMKNDRVDIGQARVDPSERNAMRLLFRVSRDPFHHLYQPLYLASGPYEFEGIYQSVDFYTDAGVRWIVRCLDPETSVLAESNRIFGASEWTQISLQFEVPETCTQQELRLISSGGSTSEQPIDGELWFDDLSIQRIDALNPVARMQSALRRRQEPQTAP